MAAQLPLGLALPDSATFANFVAGPNRQLLAGIEDSVAGDGETFIYIWGDAGLGKSHLLQAACRASDAPSVYLPFGRLEQLQVAMLEGLEHTPLICLDDIDRIAGRRDWEEALFHLYNRLRDTGSRLLVTAGARPAILPFVLPDLVSRLTAGLTFQIQPLDDDDKIAALRLRAQGRGLEFADDAGRYLLTRLPRDLPKLIDWLDRLDVASLAAQRRITVPFIREVMQAKL
jgi:DnaA family protein